MGRYVGGMLLLWGIGSCPRTPCTDVSDNAPANMSAATRLFVPPPVPPYQRPCCGRLCQHPCKQPPLPTPLHTASFSNTLANGVLFQHPCKRPFQHASAKTMQSRNSRRTELPAQQKGLAKTKEFLIMLCPKCCVMWQGIPAWSDMLWVLARLVLTFAVTDVIMR